MDAVSLGGHLQTHRESVWYYLWVGLTVYLFDVSNSRKEDMRNAISHAPALSFANEPPARLEAALASPRLRSVAVLTSLVTTRSADHLWLVW